MVRVLQQDVWRDRNGWLVYLLGALLECRERRKAGNPVRVVVPDTPLYREGVYARLHQHWPAAGADARLTEACDDGKTPTAAAGE